MSLILDALKRAERERHAERSPMLGDVPAGPVERAPSPWRTRAIVLVVLAAAGAAAAWYVSRKPAAPATESAAVAPAPAQPLPQPPPTAAQPEPEQAPPAQPPIVARAAPEVVPGTETVTSLDELTTETDAPPAAPLADPDAPATTPMPAPAPARPQPTPAPAQTSELADADTGVEPEPDAEPDLAPPRTAASPPPAETRPVPPALTQPVPRRKLREMPPEYRADFPALTVDVHVFERDQTRRFAIVNGRRYREGERLAEGPLLVEIVKEGLVLEHRGERVLFTLAR